MLFNSLAFAIFLPIVFFLYWALPNKYRSFLLLLASYYFYMSWNVKYVVLILFTTIVSYVSAVLMEKQKNKKTVLLWATIVASIGVLFFFKYFNFFDLTLVRVLNKLAIPLQPMTLKLMLPVGISFYTFQTLSYVIDVYRGSVKAEHNFFIYAAFISFFPQLVAGPIERTSNLLPQIKGAHHFQYERAAYGLRLMAWGFFKKLVIADNLAVYADQIFDDVHYYSGCSMLLAALFFTIQIYCDFSGYSDIAIGTARLFDIQLMKNFDSPYFAASIKEFWSRWHISLSTWFRDYIYIPLGGNRVRPIRHNLNLLLTFLVSGLWHGAALTYVVWGGLHGALQVIENSVLFLRKHGKQMREKGSGARGIWLSRLLTFLTIALAWVFFRAQSITEAVYFLTHMWQNIANPLSYLRKGLQDFGMDFQTALSLLLPVLLLFFYDFKALTCDPLAQLAKWKPMKRWVLYYAFVFVFLMLASFNSQEFVYFQF